MKDTGISWCDDTANLWWGCVHHGPGCAHCYAEALARRYGWDVWGPNKPRRHFAGHHFGELDKLNAVAAAAATSRRVFVGSMMDLCEDRDELVPIARSFLASARRWPWLDFLCLTKRPERYPLILPSDWGDGYPNVWLLASAVTQREVDINGEALRRLPAIVRGLSLEPLLERVTTRGMPWIHWRIVGGESGARSEARFFAPEWADVVVGDADADDAAAFVKQMGTQWAYGQSLLSRKADDPAEWPAALRQQHHPLPRRSAPVAF